MDPETGAAGYMISGGLAGGSGTVKLDVTHSLIGITALVIAIYEAIQVGIMLLAVTNIWAGLFFGVIFVLSAINLIMTLQNLIMYWQTGDYEYAKALMVDLLMNAAFAAAFKVLGWVFPGIKQLFKNVSKQMDDVAELAAKYGDDVAEVAARYGDDGVKLVNNLGEDAASLIVLYGDDAFELMNKYGDDAIKVIKNNSSDSIRIFNQYGDEAFEAIM